MKSTRLLILLLTACSTLGFSSCSTTIPRPDAPICVENVPKLQEKCYNLKTDYDDNGELIPGAKAVITPFKDEAAMLSYLNKRITTSPDGFANIKAYIRDLRAPRSGD